MSMIAEIKTRLFPKLNSRITEFDIPVFPFGTEIPKVMHQTYFSPETPPRPVPPEIQENIAFLKSTNPGWEHRLYGREEMVQFISSSYGAEVLKYFNRIDPAYGAAQADLFRYLLIYKYGGVYLDVKSSINIPFAHFLRNDDVFLLSQWRNRESEEFDGWGLHYDLRHIEGGEFQQWHIVSVPGHPFLRRVILAVLSNMDLYLPGLHGVGKMAVLRLTGPSAYTLAIAPMLGLHKHRLITNEKPFPLRYSIYGYDAHMGVFKAHYSKLKNPVVKIDARRRLLSDAMYALNRIDATLKRK